MTTYLDFEKPIAELESKIAELRHLPNSGDVDIAEEVMRLQDKVQKQLRATYAKLTPWQRVQVARHAERPHAQRYIDRLDHRLHAARRRPHLRRGRRGGGRRRAAGRPQHRRARPGEGRRHRFPHQAQFRHGAAGGLSQGAAPDEARRPLRHAGGHAGRHVRRLSRHRRRGARPGRGDRDLDRHLPRRSACRWSAW